MFEHRRKSIALRAVLLALGMTVFAGCGGGGDATPADPNQPAPSAPAAPTGLSATAGNATVSLAWTTSSSATGYKIKRATTDGGPYTQLATSTTASYSDTSSTNGTTYYYVVSATNVVGESGNSAQASATPTIPTVPVTIPAIPTGLSATPGDAQVALSWAASSGATSYNVKRGPNSGGPYTQIAAPTATAFTDNISVTNGTTYYYVVTAVNSAGQSGNSTQASAMPAASVTIPATPAGLSATAGNAQVTLSWSASSSAVSYRVKRTTANGGPYTQIAAPASAAHVDTSLANGTTYYYVVSALNSAGESANSTQASATPAAPPAANVTITVTPSTARPISPYIYGVNNAYTPGIYPSGASSLPANLTFDRLGGNRLTAYNWETNASNAGQDWLYQNDGLFPGTVPAGAVTDFITADRAAGVATLFTVQMQGLVAADESGPVSTANPPDMSRFKTVVPKKTGSAFTTTPVTADANVYMDEFVWAVNQKFAGQNIFGTAPAGPRVFVQLDNEPELWHATHLETQGPTQVTSDAYITKTINLTNALKDQFPNLVIFGPAHYGVFGLYSWNGEIAATPSGGNWFPDKYLTAIKAASNIAGKPLVDVYDFHWYPEAGDGTTRVTSLNGSSLTDAQVQAIVQSPRSLWDPTYTETSWVPSMMGGPIYILPRLQAKIDAKNPGMKLSITEYNNGGAKHIAGTLAQADNLGIFGAQGLFAATFWSLVSDEPYLLAGFRAFRNFDGAGHHFGDVSVQASSSDTSKVSAYVSTDTTRAGRVVIVAINRSVTMQTTAINGQPLSGLAHLFQMNATTAGSQSVVQPVNVGTQAVSGSSITVTLPPLSVTTIDVY
jgi:fibronectin type 3 domain-containing protein